MIEAHTLLELLLVIAMLGILYLGALSRAREAADRAMCKQYQREFKTLRETEDIPNMIRIADRCYRCHPGAPPNW